MNPPRRAVDGFAASTMLLLCAVWGAQQVAIKLAAPDLAPIYQVSLRSGLSALLVAAWSRWRGAPLDFRRETLRPGLVAAVLFAAEFLFIAEGLRRTQASHMAVFLYTAPVFTALGLHLKLPAERLRPLQWAGIGLAFGGIALAFVGGPPAGASGGAAPATLAGDLLGLLAGLAWGATTVVIRTSALSEAPPAVTLLYQLLGAFLVLLPVALLSDQAGRFGLTPTALASLIFQGVIVSFASYLAWFGLLRRYLATGLSVFSFMTPIFGVTFGVLVLGEPLGRSFLGGAALVLAGIVLVSGAGWPRRRAA